MVSESAAREFLARGPLAFVGVSRDPHAFSASVYRELRQRGHELIPVNPAASEVQGDCCYPSVAELPDRVAGVIVMVTAERSADVVRACIERGFDRVWLFQGLGPSSVSDEAVALSREHGVQLIEGACPLMFATPVGWFHRIHRGSRRLAGDLTA